MKTTFLITFICLGLTFCSGCSKDKEEPKEPDTLSKQELPENTEQKLTNEKKVELEMFNALEAAGEEYRTGNVKKRDNSSKQELPENKKEKLTHSQQLDEEMFNALEEATEELKSGNLKK